MKDLKTDRRVLRTRDTLGDALVALMHEKSFEDITVQDLLDRAGVGRSTFYAHYRDKNDLFLSDVEDFLEKLATALKREFYLALVKSEKMHDVHALARGFFARSIEERLQTADIEMEPVRRTAQAHALAGSLLSLLDWWIDKGMKADPEEMDALFHQMAWSGLATR